MSATATESPPDPEKEEARQPAKLRAPDDHTNKPNYANHSIDPAFWQAVESYL